MRVKYTASKSVTTEAYAIAARAEEERTSNMIKALEVSDFYITPAQKLELGKLIVERLSDDQ